MRKNVYDVSDKARYYAEHPWKHYKTEVYPIFADMLGTLEDGSTVLDIGGGPGHLPSVLFGERPKADIRYFILDGSRELLKYAAERFAGDERIRTGIIDFNAPEWRRDLPAADAVVCNNALFHLKPERLADFYTELDGVLKPGGFYLNQQSMLYPGGYHPYEENRITALLAKMPYTVMPQICDYSEEEWTALRESEAATSRRHGEEIRQAKAEEEIDPTPYHFHLQEDHLEALRRTGMEATTIWQKKEFFVILAVK